jgi:hypothetical protein
LDAIALIFTKFSAELIAAQLAVLFFASSLAVYWMLVRKKKRETTEWVPAALVRAYLDRVQADERETRFKLFGEHSPMATQAPLAAALSGAVASAGAVDPGLKQELEALRSQLALADQRVLEFDRNMNALKAEKTALEQKLKDAQAGAAAGAPTAAPAAANEELAAAQKQLAEMKAKLEEYEVIEDDLANLKKFQKENETLRQKVEQYEKGGSTATTVSGSAPTPDPKMVVSGGQEPAQPTMTVIPGGAGSAPAETVIPKAAAPAPEPAAANAETNTNVLQPVTPSLEAAAPAAAPAAGPTEAAPAAAGEPAAAASVPAEPEKSAQKKEEELLSEFEKMLAS